jgi:two-component system, OmpR family, sensor histidine kinase PrrB
VRLPGSLRARIALAAVLVLAIVGTLTGAVALAAIGRDGRDAVDEDLRERLEQVGRRGFGGYDRGHGRPGPGYEDRGLLAGSGTFTQVAFAGEVVDRRGDVPAEPPAVPGEDGFETVEIDGDEWRSLTASGGPRGQLRVQVLSSLAPVEARVNRIRDIVVLLGLGALALTGLAAWGATSLAVRPLARLGEGAARVEGADDLRTPLPDDDGPDEVRTLARTLNGMLARLQASTDAMQRALQATRRFAADAGHELRTPLTGLRANLDALARNPDLPLEQREALVREMASDQDRMVHLLEGLQALARGDAADSLPRERVEVADLVDAAVYDARRRHPGVDYALHEDVGDAAVEGWPGGLRLIVDNLLDNAALHGHPGGHVDVAVRRADGALRVEVADDGPGIPAAERARLLEPFARGGRTTAPGTGLGLAIVAQQVGLHGGTLDLDDSPRGGLSVIVRLPA